MYPETGTSGRERGVIQKKKRVNHGKARSACRTHQRKEIRTTSLNNKRNVPLGVILGGSEDEKKERRRETKHTEGGEDSSEHFFKEKNQGRWQIMGLGRWKIKVNGGTTTPCPTPLWEKACNRRLKEGDSITQRGLIFTAVNALQEGAVLIRYFNNTAARSFWKRSVASLKFLTVPTKNGHKSNRVNALKKKFSWTAGGRKEAMFLTGVLSKPACRA